MVIAVRQIGSTPTAIMGALEPLTAVVIGITIFNEIFTLRLAVGIMMILIAVILIIIGKSIQIKTLTVAIIYIGQIFHKPWQPKWNYLNCKLIKSFYFLYTIILYHNFKIAKTGVWLFKCNSYYNAKHVRKNVKAEISRLLSEYSQRKVSASEIVEAIEELANHLADFSINEQDYSVLLRYFSFGLHSGK